MAMSSSVVAVDNYDNKPALSGSSFDRVDSMMRDDNLDGDNLTHQNLGSAGVKLSTNSTAAAAAATTPVAARSGLPTPINTASISGDKARVLGLHEYKAAAQCLAEAFGVDEMAMYFIDTPDRENWTAEQKWALHVKIMEYITYAHLLKGLVVSAGPNYDCVALWMPPGNNMDDLLTICRSGMWRLNFELSREGKKRFFDEFLPLLHDTKAQVLGARDPSSWYLVYIGTKPAGRGKGYARKVIEYVTRRADAERRACYLESSSAVNRIIYGKMGFELQKSIYLQRAVKHVELDIMVREPVGKAAKK